MTCQLYLISPPQISLDQFLPQLDDVLSTDLVSVFQLRLKDMPMVAIERALPPIIEVCHNYNVPLILNDYVELAARFDCDGLHLGQQDMPIADARKILGPDKMIGATCHDSKHLAMEAAEQGADYVAFGAFYPTTTKDYGFRPKPDLLRDWSDGSLIPCVAIGGITPDNCQPLIESGADLIAVVSYIWQNSKGPKAATEAFRPFLAA